MPDKAKELTDQKYWDQVWKGATLPQTLKPPYHPYYVDVLDDYFKRYLPNSSEMELLELGTTPGTWLHYFHTEFGYKVSGIDNSPVGLRTTRENMQRLKVNADILEGDLYTYRFVKQYDVVFSDGLIEHSFPIESIIKKHLELTKPGGFCVIGVPNIKKAFYGIWQRMTNLESYKTYNHVSCDDLKAVFIKEQGEIISCQPVGVFNLYVIYTSSKSMLRLLTFLENVADKILKFFKVTRETKLFSPYIFIIFKKNEWPG